MSAGATLLADPEEVRARARRGAARLLRERLKPPPQLSVSEWADLHRYLPSTSAEPGRWRTDRTPYLREIMDAFSDPMVERVVFMKAAQIGGSEALMNVLAYFIDQDPAPVLFVCISDGEAAKFSKERVAPMIRDTPVLEALIAPVKSRNSSNTIEAKEFPGGHLGIVGATAPSKLRARPRRVVLFDEVDGYPSSAGAEGDPIELGVKRTSTYWNRKIGMISTPTVKGVSRIENAFEESDQRQYLVPCPHCDSFQQLQWEQLKWEKDPQGRHLPESARYECSSCGERIGEKHKQRMLTRGRWEAQNPESSIAGFHLSALYSPWFPWAELVREFLSAKNHREKLRVFVNTRLAETYEERGDAPEWERLYARRESFPIGTCPEGVEFLTAGVDVQLDRIEASVWGWGYDRESWLVDHLVIGGDTSYPDTWDELTEVLHRTWPAANGEDLPLARMAVDTGYNQQAAVAWARKVGDGRIMLVKGDHWKNWTTIIGSPTKSDVTVRGRKTGLLLWPVGGALIKQETYGFLRLPHPIDGDPFPPGYIHLPMVDDEFCRGLVSEDLVTGEDKKGFPRQEWVKNRRRNEPLDCRVYARAAAEQQGLSRMVRPEGPGPTQPPRPRGGRPPGGDDGGGDADRRRGDWLSRGGGRRRGKWLK
jgi:phage terminase large subunit GpA-like protein